tara:strand:+ start:4179 stop:4721 length:543 start_codon:yes stop_codon:yes gene_type:complete
MSDLGQNLLLTSLTDFYNKNNEYKTILKNIINGNHKLSLRIIEWLVTHYSKSNNIYYWINENKNIYMDYPENSTEVVRKINLYQDYRAQLKSYSKFNFDSFRRHHRITFFINNDKTDYIETTVGQLNFFRWIFNNNIITYAINNYDYIYKKMIENNLCKQKINNNNNHDIIKTKCLLTFD